MECAHTRVNVCVNLRTTLGVTPWDAVLKKDLSQAWSLQRKLNWLASGPQTSTCLCLPTRELHVHASIPAFYKMWVLGIELGLLCVKGQHFIE